MSPVDDHEMLKFDELKKTQCDDDNKNRRLFHSFFCSTDSKSSQNDKQQERGSSGGGGKGCGDGKSPGDAKELHGHVLLLFIKTKRAVTLEVDNITTTTMLWDEGFSVPHRLVRAKKHTPTYMGSRYSLSPMRKCG